MLTAARLTPKYSSRVREEMFDNVVLLPSLLQRKEKKKEGHFKYLRMTYENGQTCGSEVRPCMPGTSNANPLISRNFVYKARKT